MTPHASEPSCRPVPATSQASAPSGVFQLIGVVYTLLVMALCFAPGAFV